MLRPPVASPRLKRRLRFALGCASRHLRCASVRRRAHIYENNQSLQSGGEREIRITGVLGLDVSPVRRRDKFFQFLRGQRLPSLGDDPFIHFLHRRRGRIDHWNVVAYWSRFSLRGNH